MFSIERHCRDFGVPVDRQRLAIIPRGLRRAPCASRSGDQRNLVVRVVEKSCNSRLVNARFAGDCSLSWDMRGGVPFEEHLSGVATESLFTDSIPTVVGIADIRAEHPQPCRRCATLFGVLVVPAVGRGQRA